MKYVGVIVVVTFLAAVAAPACAAGPGRGLKTYLPVCYPGNIRDYDVSTCPYNSVKCTVGPIAAGKKARATCTYGVVVYVCFAADKESVVFKDASGRVLTNIMKAYIKGGNGYCVFSHGPYNTPKTCGYRQNRCGFSRAVFCVPKPPVSPPRRSPPPHSPPHRSPPPHSPPHRSPPPHSPPHRSPPPHSPPHRSPPPHSPPPPSPPPGSPPPPTQSPPPPPVVLPPESSPPQSPPPPTQSPPPPPESPPPQSTPPPPSQSPPPPPVVLPPESSPPQSPPPPTQSPPPPPESPPPQSPPPPTQSPPPPLESPPPPQSPPPPTCQCADNILAALEAADPPFSLAGYCPGSTLPDVDITVCGNSITASPTDVSDCFGSVDYTAKCPGSDIVYTSNKTYEVATDSNFMLHAASGQCPSATTTCFPALGATVSNPMCSVAGNCTVKVTYTITGSCGDTGTDSLFYNVPAAAGA